MPEHADPIRITIESIASDTTTTPGDGYPIGRWVEPIAAGRREDRADPATGGNSSSNSELLADGGPVVAEDASGTVPDPRTDGADDPPAADTATAPRTRRAREEEMDVSLLRKGGSYEVHSASGNVYEVDIAAGTCTCLDWQRREPDGGCKHLRRVDMEIKAGTVPRPDGRVPGRSVGNGSRDGATVACERRIADRIHALDAAIERQRAERNGLRAALALIEEFHGPQQPSGQDECEAN